MLLVIHEHLDAMHDWLSGFKDDNGVATTDKKPIVPRITEEQIERLMLLAFDKDMPRALIHSLYFFRNAEAGMADGSAMCLPMETYEAIMDELEHELVSLRVQYEQERNDNPHFPPLPDAPEWEKVGQ